MDFFKLKRKPSPAASVSHPGLGKLVWSREDNGWAGALGDLAFCLSSEGEPEPSLALLAYAESLLCPPTPLMDGLQREKSRWLAEYQDNAAEVEFLVYGQVTFHRHKGRNRVFATLDPEINDRAWRLEFKEHTCVGLGFDS